MTEARRWGSALLIGAVAGLTVFAAAPATAAGSTPEAAYWWQPEPVAGLIPVPGVPSNGLFVSSAASGPQAESAVRFAVADQTARVRLTLHVSSQERVGTPAVEGYPATSDWSSGGPQAWSARPSYRSHATPAKGVFHTAGANPTMTITFPASDAVNGIVLVPAGTEVGGQAPTFSVSFAPPTPADVAVLGSSSPSAIATTRRPPGSGQSTAGGGGTSKPASTSGSNPSITRQTRAIRGTVPPAATGSPAAMPPASPRAAGRDDGPGNSDTGTTMAIVVAGVIAASLLVVAGRRGIRRD